MSGFVGYADSNDGGKNVDNTIAGEYEQAISLIRRLESGEFFPMSKEFRILHADCLEQLSSCLLHTEQLSLFSSNESLEDINTKALKFLNLNFYIAKVIERTPIDPSKTSVDARMSIGHLAARKYIEFLSQLNDYGLLETKALGTLVDSLLPHGTRGPFNMNGLLRTKQDRTSKTESHRHLFKLTQAYEEARNLWSSAGNSDEEKLRDLEISRLILHRAKAWEGVYGILDELNVLSMAATNFSVAPLQERSVPYIPSPYLVRTVIQQMLTKQGVNFDTLRKNWDARNSSDFSTRVENTVDDSLTGPRGEIRRPFVITSGNVESQRKHVASQVFGTGQYLPTVTIEELIEKELANRATPEQEKPEQDEDRDDVSDALTVKARKWDDFKDSVAKGSGNTLNLG